MSSYPKWLYHPTKDAQIVTDEAAHKALGDEWAESPAAFSKSVALEQAIEALDAEISAAKTETLQKAAKKKGGK